jgi:hypothetical protein
LICSSSIVADKPVQADFSGPQQLACCTSIAEMIARDWFGAEQSALRRSEPMTGRFFRFTVIVALLLLAAQVG